jgi:CHAD domain-containing protein
MKALEKYLKTRKKTLLRLLEKPEKKYTTATFHQLRVEIKKLNALFDLVDSSSKKFSRKKMITPFKTIFRQAGKVRNLQIEEACFKKHIQDDQLTEYRARLKKRQLKKTRLFLSLINDKTTAQLKNKYDKTTPFLSSIDNEKVDEYMLKKREKIKNFLSQPNLEIDQLHQLRKLLKIYYYNQISLSLEQQKQKISMKEPLTELLGKWNDGMLIIGHLQKTIEKANVNLEEIALLETLKIKITAENNVLFDQIKLAISESELFE